MRHQGWVRYLPTMDPRLGSVKQQKYILINCHCFLLEMSNQIRAKWQKYSVAELDHAADMVRSKEIQ